MVFVKAAINIVTNLDFITRNGIRALLEGMRTARKFDPDNPFPNYDAKNAYFNPANNICQFSLWKLGLYDLCEKYYTRMLEEIRKYETDNQTNFNKGMVYANLSVSQITQGKIDEGFANILKAHMEDEPYHRTDPSKTVFTNPLYLQFEDRIKALIHGHSDLYQQEETREINESFVKRLVSSLDTDSRILFISLVEKIRRNLEILTDKDNRFTRLKIFLCLQDLCLSFENALKVKNNLTGNLKTILDRLFSTGSGRQRDPWKPIFDTNYRFTSSNNATQFESNLKNIFAIEDNKARRLLLCCAVRNFSSHNLDVSNNYVFQNIENIFNNILSAIFYLHDSRCI